MYYYMNYITINGQKKYIMDIFYESKIDGVYCFEGMFPVHHFENPKSDREHTIARWGCASDSMNTYAQKIENEIYYWRGFDDDDFISFTFPVITEYGACTGWIKRISKMYPVEVILYYDSDSKHYGGYKVCKGVLKRILFDNYIDYLYTITLGRLSEPLAKLGDSVNKFIDNLFFTDKNM